MFILMGGEGGEVKKHQEMECNRSMWDVAFVFFITVFL